MHWVAPSPYTLTYILYRLLPPPRPPRPPPPPPYPYMDNLEAINRRADLNFFECYNQIYRDDVLNDYPYFGIDLTCNYIDVNSIYSLPSSPLFLSINIQSLHSKHEQLVHLLHEFHKLNKTVDVIAVQEIWEVRYPELLIIPGFKQLMFKRRRNMRGGGVGFFVREGLSATIIDECSPFKNKIFESITIQVSYSSSILYFAHQCI
jgi:hypothetical protein